MKLLMTLALILISFSSFSSSNYYPTKTHHILSSNTSNERLVLETIKNVLNKFHVTVSGKRDILVAHCGQNQSRGVCYTQKVLGYHGARKILFGQMFLIESLRGLTLKEVYCNKVYTKRSLDLGRNKIPNHTKVNCEHTWPQSKFSTRFPREMQKSDLHHLFPTNSKANSIRGNYLFANVDIELESNLCDSSRFGISGNSTGTFFEPPREQKGNVARALFYFSVRYSLKINDYQEKFLRKWHKLDPVDSAEMARNDIIFKTQGNRNPFVDYPNLEEVISNF